MFCFQSFWWKFRMWLAKQCFHIDVHNYFQSKHKYNTTTSGHIASIHDIHTDVGLHFLWKQRLPNRRRSEIETPVVVQNKTCRVLQNKSKSDLTNIRSIDDVITLTPWKTQNKFKIWYAIYNVEHWLEKGYWT